VPSCGSSYARPMPKRSSMPSGRDGVASGSVSKARDEALPLAREPDKNPHAVALGRMGGLKGGKARAEKLTPEQRSLIAKRAAQARWSSKGKGHDSAR
jgi:hypothetical protein